MRPFARFTALILTALTLAAFCLAAAPARASEKKKGKDDKEANSPIFGVEALSISVRKADGRWGVLTIEPNLSVASPQLRAQARASMPRLRAAYTQVLTSYGAKIGGGGPPDIDVVLLQLQQATDKTLGKPGAKVLIGGLTLN